MSISHETNHHSGESALRAQAAPGSGSSAQPEKTSGERLPACTSDRFVPVTHWNQRHAWPPIGGLRHLIFNAQSNGFDQVIRRVGRRVLIDEQAFFAWVDRSGRAE